MDFCTLYSGSSGNACYVGKDDFGILVDAGVSCSRILSALGRQNIDLSAIKALFLTHDHSDHVKGVTVLCKKLDIPVYASLKVWNALEGKVTVPSRHQRIFTPDEAFDVGPLEVLPFAVPHDGAETVGYALCDGRQKICTVTDLGHIPPRFFEAVKNANVLLLESNHEVDMLVNGPYPEYLKSRILGNNGHLSNETAASAIYKGLDFNIRHVMLAHLSRENNTPAKALQTVGDHLTAWGAALGRDIDMKVAPADTPGYFYHTEEIA